jgi:adenosine kinase
MEGRKSTPGGSSLNSARAANFILRKENAGNVAFIGCIGNDDAGNTLVEALKEVHMFGEFARTEETGTGQCAVLVNGKERTLCANIGASAKYPTQHLIDNMVSLQMIST